MIIRNGQALGSVLHSAAPSAERPKPLTPETKPVEAEADQAARHDDPPKEYDPKHAWVDFAVSQGAVRGEAEELTKRELVELYGGEQ